MTFGPKSRKCSVNSCPELGVWGGRLHDGLERVAGRREGQVSPTEEEVNPRLENNGKVEPAGVGNSIGSGGLREEVSVRAREAESGELRTHGARPSCVRCSRQQETRVDSPTEESLGKLLAQH